ncbi:hypothetical protein CDAR_427821 [Caerostris darwini]|uniref:60S ribosomal protein L29 n=1 Tax=Caerostris darwini TaxID=1538125 RepID=A0AAV4Q8L4_9ARAC|nr:hypothetical protein CDAR_427821 [Caerostris darwini]
MNSSKIFHLPPPTPNRYKFKKAKHPKHMQKHQSAANNRRSPTWEKACLIIEECSRRIRAICTYNGVPASHLPAKKELAEIKKAKELQAELAAEAAKTVAPAPNPIMPQQSTTSTVPTPKRKTTMTRVLKPSPQKRRKKG